jgi:hypothetical protein
MSHGGPAAAPEDLHTNMVEISSAEEYQAYQRMYKNKIVLIFKIQFLAKQVQDWLIYYNHRGSCHLTYHSELKNSMFIVQLESTTEAGDLEKTHLQISISGQGRVCIC